MTKVSIGFHVKRNQWVVTYNGNILGDDRAYPTWEKAWDEAERRVNALPSVYVLVQMPSNCNIG